MDRTTDVLSFSMLGGGAKNEWVGTRSGSGPDNSSAGSSADAPPLSLGDVVISAPRAAVQAGELGQSLEAELLFLLVHGILHLVGYDHEGPAPERLKMERRQRKLIRLIETAR
jgi:probable rRNA maturation factor